MQSLQNKRQQLSISIRTQLRNNCILEKRKKLMAKLTSMDSLIQYSPLQHSPTPHQTITDTHTTLEDKLKYLVDIHQQISRGVQVELREEGVGQFVAMLSNNVLVPYVTEVLVLYTAAEWIQPSHVQLLSKSAPILLNLISPDDLEVFQSVIYIIGNLTIDQPSLKDIIISEAYYSKILAALHSSSNSQKFINAVLWQVKNLFLTSKHKLNLYHPPHQFCEWLISLVATVLGLLEARSTEETVVDNYKGCLLVLELVLNTHKIVTPTFQGILNNLGVDLVDITNTGVNPSVAKGILGLMVTTCNINSKCLPSGTASLLQQLIQKSMSPQCSNTPLLTKAIELSLSLQNQQLFVYMITHLSSFKESFSKAQTKLKWSQFFLYILCSIPDLQFPSTPLEHSILLHLSTLLNRLNLLLLDSASQTSYNGVKSIYHLLSIVQIPTDLKDSLSEHGILDSLLQLQLHPDKEIYEMVDKVLVLLEMEGE